MQILIKKSTAAFLLIAMANLVVAFLTFFILPPKFFYDSAIIIYDRWNEAGYLGSYPLTILFYKITGLRYLPFPVIALLQFPVLMFVLYKIGIPENFEKINVKNILVYLGIFMMAVFISMPSKEFITFLFITPIVFLFSNRRYSFKKTVYISFLLLIVFGVFYRPYFALIPIIAYGMYLISFINFKNQVLTTIFYGLLIAFFLSLSYGLVKGEYFSEMSREVVNNARMGSADANSMIVPPLKPDTWYGEAIAVFYGFFSVNVPVNGLKHLLSPQILVFVIWQLFLSYILLVRFSKCLKNRNDMQYELFVFFILFSFFIIQGVFEPDLGSAVKHKTGIFPLIYFALYYEYFRKKLQ
ncbi:hypothetical protein [Flavobacterium sp. 1355]|uniref:hypothetical protein n=1 Tax=Flavobacterium sp. 1355 TaxID=2806571 RepID=UPI001AE35AAC|nr:hypothetical protein [Flavobacterium sp. 1355]MBP1222153.1 hypothetical protein [Flavobacterium sp. 1355]